MNFFESELKKIMGDSAILKDQKYVGRMCYGTIGGDLRARVEFVTLGVSDHYAGIKASVINRKEGVVDSILLQFSDIWGKQKVSNPNFKEGVNPHIWTDSGKSDVDQGKCIVDMSSLVRRLIPLECERLMGFPDYWTDIPGASDSARYRALGNSVAVPCVDSILCGIAYFLRKMGEEEEDVYLSR